MQGGMTMVSDLFNYNLKNLVNNVCSDIANELSNHQTTPFAGSFQSQSQNGSNSQMQAGGSMGSNNSLFVPAPEANWWPQDLGSPNALGSQNNVKYADFGNAHRVAVKTGGEVWVYDTQNHQIGGFSQQQGSGGSITFTSQFGTVNLSMLPVISRNGVAIPPPAPMPSQPLPSQPEPPRPILETPVDPTNTGSSDLAVNNSQSSPNSHNIIETLERLGGLRDKNYITEEEFQSKKAELLGRI